MTCLILFDLVDDPGRVVNRSYVSWMCILRNSLYFLQHLNETLQDCGTSLATEM